MSRNAKRSPLGLERRALGGPLRLNIRSDGDGGSPAGLPTIVGHAAVFGVWTSIGGYFEESIRAGAFDNALRENQDVRGLFNHDANLILGRTAAGTVRLALDAIGLGYEIDPPDVSYARDLVVSMERKDVTQSSFAFAVRPGGAVWTLVEGAGADGGDVWRRELTDLDLFDVSPVVYPAYTDADSGLRSADYAPALRSLALECERRGLPGPGVPGTDASPATRSGCRCKSGCPRCAPSNSDRWLWMSRHR